MRLTPATRIPVMPVATQSTPMTRIFAPCFPIINSSAASASYVANTVFHDTPSSFALIREERNRAPLSISPPRICLGDGAVQLPVQRLRPSGGQVRSAADENSRGSQEASVIIGLHPVSAKYPGTKGGIMIGLIIDEPIERAPTRPTE